MTKALIVDVLAHVRGRRLWTRDVVGSGPRVVGGVLEQNGVDVDLIPGEVLVERPGVLDGYDILLLSGMVVDAPAISRVLSLWRKRRGRRPVVAGGPVSQIAEGLLSLGVDLVVVGEAERTVDELAKTSLFEEGRLAKEELAKVRGLFYLDNGKPRYTGPRPPLTTTDLSRYRPSCRLAQHYPGFWALRFYVEVVRGCSNFKAPPIGLELSKPYPGCAYCGVASYWGPARSMPLKRVLEEVECLFEIGVNRVVLSGPDVLDYGRDWVSPTGLFAVDPENPPPNLEALLGLFKGVCERAPGLGEKGSVIVENVKPSTVNEQTAALLGEYFAGTPVNIGVESGDESLLSRMGRGWGLRRSLEAVRLLRQHGLLPQVYLIYGLPGQDEASVERTLELLGALREAGADRVILYRLTPLPRTALEGFSRPRELAHHERRLEEEVRRLNARLKRALAGRRLMSVVVSVIGGRAVCYPVKHGPVIYASPPKGRRPEELVGRLVKVVVTDVASDRAVTGRVLTVGKPVARPSRWERVG